MRYAAPAVLSPDPDQARDWFARELSRPAYQESLVERVRDWVRDLLDRVQAAAENSGGLGVVVAIVILVVLVGLLAFALSRLRREPGGATDAAAVFADVRRSAAEHRRRAREALADQRWDDAVLEAVRALAAGLIERGLLEEQAGITVREIQTRAVSLFPDHGADLESAAATFEETRYGDRRADEDHARELVLLESQLAAAVPRSAAGGPTVAVPR